MTLILTQNCTASWCSRSTGVVAFDLGVPTQIFHGARDAHERRYYDVKIVTPDGQPVRSSAGFLVTPEARPRADRHRRHGDRGRHPLRPGQHRSARCRRTWRPRSPGSRRRPGLMSICTGAFVLAAAGLLDGRPATTHWAWADDFRRMFPDVKLDPDVLFVDDGDILTSAGVAAGIDLCLHVIRSDLRRRRGQPRGPARRGRAVARRRSVAVHRAADAGAGRTPAPRPPETGWPSDCTRTSTWRRWPGTRG